MRRAFPHQRLPHRSGPPARPAVPWWRPLTNRWGVLGLIIFIGLVFSVIESVSRWGR